MIDLLDRIIGRLYEDPARRAVELVELSDLQERLAAPHDLAAFQRLAFPRFGRREDAEVRTVGDRERRHVVVRTHITDRRGTTFAVHDPPRQPRWARCTGCSCGAATRRPSASATGSWW